MVVGSLIHNRFYFHVINTCYILQQLQEASMFSRPMIQKDRRWRKKKWVDWKT